MERRMILIVMVSLMRNIIPVLTITFAWIIVHVGRALRGCYVC